MHHARRAAHNLRRAVCAAQRAARPCPGAVRDPRHAGSAAQCMARGARRASSLRAFHDRHASGPVELLWTWYFGFMTQMFCRRIRLKPRLDSRNYARLEETDSRPDLRSEARLEETDSRLDSRSEARLEETDSRLDSRSEARVEETDSRLDLRSEA